MGSVGAARAADIGCGLGQTTGDTDGRRCVPPARGRLARDHVLLRTTACIDLRGRASHKDRLSGIPGPERRIHGPRKPGQQFNAVVLERAESARFEGDRIGAGLQICDPVLTFTVGDDRAYTFNQGRTGGFDGDAGDRLPRRIFDCTGDAAQRLLRRRHRREEDTRQHDETETEGSQH